MQTTTPVTGPVSETADVPPPRRAAAPSPESDASLLVAATVRENFTTLTELFKAHFTAKHTAAIADTKATAVEGYITRGYSFLMVLLCLGAVLFLSTQKVLNGVSAGTLTGTIIGYALSHLRPTTNE